MRLIFLFLLSIFWQTQCFASQNIIKALQSTYDVSRLEFSISVLKQSIQRKIDKLDFPFSSDPDREAFIYYVQGDTLTKTSPSLRISVSVDCGVLISKCSEDVLAENLADAAAKNVYMELGHFGDPSNLNSSGKNMFHLELGRRFSAPFSMDFYGVSADAIVQETNAIAIGSELAKILEVIVDVKLYGDSRPVVFDYKINVKPGSGRWFDDRNRIRREF